MKIFKANNSKEIESAAAKAARVVRNGGIVAFPTETVYGLGVDAENSEAVTRLFKLKKRDERKPFTRLISSVEMINPGCNIVRDAKKVMEEFWPGPLTIILKCSDKKIGFRMPSCEIALKLVEKANVPLAAPSANPGGMPNPVEARTVLNYFRDKIDVLIDGGKTRLGVESTIIDFSKPKKKLLREGALKVEEIENATGIKLT
ncbi:MAG: threonylcarbamoyl-AMP synthase [Candidatus Aureabacteria bacterium]|nr:threonylcarbamoyl-AMP synthase [Candidatus Auribacterota bacterium]